MIQPPDFTQIILILLGGGIGVLSSLLCGYIFSKDVAHTLSDVAREFISWAMPFAIIIVLWLLAASLGQTPFTWPSFVGALYATFAAITAAKVGYNAVQGVQAFRERQAKKAAKQRLAQGHRSEP